MRKLISIILFSSVFLFNTAQTPISVQADFNGDGVVNVPDLQTFLSVYATVVPLDIIPMWIDWNQDINCNTVPHVFPHQLVDGVLMEFNEYDSIQWYFNQELVGRGDSLLLETYFPDTLIENSWVINCSGWQIPCNGIIDLTCRVYHNGYAYQRTEETLLILANQPDWIPDCDEICCPGNGMYFQQFTPFQFLINGNQ